MIDNKYYSAVVRFHLQATEDGGISPPAEGFDGVIYIAPAKEEVLPLFLAYSRYLMLSPCALYRLLVPH
ncbi:hypothetical protein EON65_58010 [archaeon]|nr:MAG: hypothetical protein EON65_58010 [archaeon]